MEDSILREYIPKRISIDGRNIKYRLVTALNYFKAKYGWDDEQIEKYQEENYQIYLLVNQIMALKQSCYLLRRVSYSCGSLSDNLYDLKMRLILELKEEYQFDFDDDFVERCGFDEK